MEPQRGWLLLPRSHEPYALGFGSKAHVLCSTSVTNYKFVEIQMSEEQVGLERTTVIDGNL